MFSEEFLDNLPEEPVNAALMICVEFERAVQSIEPSEKNYDSYAEAYVVLETCCTANSLPWTSIDLDELEGAGDISLAIYPKLVVSHFKYMKDRLKDRKTVQSIGSTLDSVRNKYESRFGELHLYEFTTGDLDRIQELINELREIVVFGDVFDGNHKKRMLTRLEALQQELNKTMSSIDRFWGLLGDAGVALGKFGRDAEPFVARVREIAQIVWRAQARSEELPSNAEFPRLSVEHDDQ